MNSTCVYCNKLEVESYFLAKKDLLSTADELLF